MPWSLLPGTSIEDHFVLLARPLLRVLQVCTSRVHLRPVLDLYRHGVLAVQLDRPQVAHRVLLHLLGLLEDLLELRLPLRGIEAASIRCRQGVSLTLRLRLALDGGLGRRLVHLARRLQLLRSIPARRHSVLPTRAHRAT